jgi:uncharacterized membrane protein YoaK (UPF0700 family)
MKRQNIFLGIVLIGIGVFFLLKQFQLPLIQQLYSWPSLLVILGLAFFLQSLFGKDDGSMFPGIVLLGLGIHFHAVQLFPFWPESWAMYTLIVSIAFLFRYQKTKKDGLSAGVILLMVSIFGFMYDAYQGWVGSIFTAVETFWPIALIVIGAYLLFRRK